MLDPDEVDLDELAQALDDHSSDVSYGHSWWLDPRTGEVRFHVQDLGDETLDDLEEAGLVPVGPQPSSVGYADMEDFIALVPDRRAQDLLARAIEGRGAFRRFKDTLLEFAELREDWFAFSDARSRRHAIEWLHDVGLVTPERAREAMAQHRDRPVGGPIATLPRAVSVGLGDLYGDRLVDVFVFGSRARGDASPDSDLDLLVVLDTVEDPWAEHRRMEPLLWQHTVASGVVVSALPVARARFDAPDEPVLMRAREEAIPA